MKRVAISLIITWSIAGCSSSKPPSGDTWLRGLDKVVLEEVITNPNAKEIRLELAAGIEEGHPGSARGRNEIDRMTLQAMVIQFIVCRDVARVYEGWRNGGKMPALAPPPRPESPLGNTYWGWPGVREYLRQWRNKGDHASLRRWVTGPTPDAKRPSRVTSKTPCGQWIPAKPDDVEGPTIAQAIEANDQ